MPDPLPFGVSLKDLRPTHLTVGFREVEIKRRQWRDADDAERTKLLRRHVVPAVLGPKERIYIVDHHHFSMAVLEEKAGVVGVFIRANLSHLGKSEFWTFLDNSDWCHAYDAKGNRRALSDIPKSICSPFARSAPFRRLIEKGRPANERPEQGQAVPGFLRGPRLLPAC